MAVPLGASQIGDGKPGKQRHHENQEERLTPTHRERQERPGSEEEALTAATL